MAAASEQFVNARRASSPSSADATWVRTQDSAKRKNKNQLQQTFMHTVVSDGSGTLDWTWKDSSVQCKVSSWQQTVRSFCLSTFLFFKKQQFYFVGRTGLAKALLVITSCQWFLSLAHNTGWRWDTNDGKVKVKMLNLEVDRSLTRVTAVSAAPLVHVAVAHGSLQMWGFILYIVIKLRGLTSIWIFRRIFKNGRRETARESGEWGKEELCGV